ncbi:ParA family protein [Lactiplantibacillus plantarum]|uniref:ParA family protein n=1 Tax=Lactiplantibacillus plantarum TaxID=1590 RepID=UPI001C025CE6|nr:AAA family ATPase [Lactiplantibacillus plantarum]MBT9656360.1 AAA family ATPase [Lactiplantibacillus plantarum]
MTCKTLLHFNFKGGVGKTTLSVMDTYLLGELGHKVLLIDLDPQANATEIMRTTYDVKTEPDVDLFNGLLKLDLTHSIIELTDNVSMIPADWSLSLWPGKVEKIKNHDRMLILKTLIEQFKSQFEYIIIDVPPTLSIFTNNAILASDYVSLVLQTQKQAYTSVLKTAQYMYQLKNDYHATFDVSGVILYLVKRDAKVDREITKAATESFGDAVFINRIWQQERVKLFSNAGIKDEDYWDKKAISMYTMVLKEELHRIEEINNG